MCQANSSRMQSLINQRWKGAFLISAMAWATVLTAALTFADPPPMSTFHSGTIAIDPGHGGPDIGARGPTGLLEKKLVMELAHQLALEMEPDFHVILTRSGDYQVDLKQRTAIANNAGADLLISLHMGASYQHAVRGRTIYYHSATPQTGKHNPKHANGTQPLWHQIQSRHTQASQALAGALKTQLDKIPKSMPCQIQPAPLAVLQGADMPAVLIELGRITHSDTEKTMAAPDGITSLVKAIGHGINSFVDQGTTFRRP